jgi:hypothetical protein
MNAQKGIAQSKLLAVIALLGLLTGLADTALAEVPTSGADTYLLQEGVPVPGRVAALNGSDPDMNQPGTKQFSYLTVSGITFTPRYSTVTFAYGYNGCVTLTSGAGYLNTSFDLPQGSSIQYLRLFYDVTDPAATITSWLTTYNPQTESTSDRASVFSPSGGPGLGTALSGKVDHTVEKSTYSYTLIASFSAAASNVRFCGLRIAYYPPSYLEVQ